VTTLKVDAGVLRSVGTSFGKAGDGLRSLHPDASLAAAAAAVSSLQTAAACVAAQSEVAAATAEVADDARHFSENLLTAACWYDTRDQAGAEAIAKIEIPD
jgi:hypothetical protein